MVESLMHDESVPHGEPDPFRLNRFLEAQAGVYESALAELRRGRKTGHWMWFIFPQIDGLGRSPAARFYAIKSPEEAKGYLSHPALGARLQQCSEALLDLEESSASEILGFPDDLKLRSSMTLFATIAGSDSVFSRVLGRFFGGQPDPRTLELLNGES